MNFHAPDYELSAISNNCLCNMYMCIKYYTYNNMYCRLRLALWNVHDCHGDSRDDVTNEVAWLVAEDPANDG